MRNALARIPATDWVARDRFLGIERSIHALGRLSNLRELAESGSSRAQYLVGRTAQHGMFGHPGDQTEAIEWFRRAAAQNDPLAQNEMAFLYERGAGVPQNSAEALRLYTAAADQGDSFARHNLGLAYALGRGIEQDYARAMALFRQAAEQNNFQSFLSISDLYAYGLGVPQDFAQAAIWVRRSAMRDHGASQNALGVHLYEGRPGVPQNQTEGLMWLRRAAASGDREARTYLTQRSLPLQ